MKKYHKIQSIFKRDKETHKFTSEFSRPEFEYLQNNIWTWDEKIDGMNTKIVIENENLVFGGKTDRAQIPAPLVNKLNAMFTFDQVKKISPDANSIILYGEGFGKGIQTGGKYISNGVDFILFDVLIDNWWLRREDVEDIANKLDINVVPQVGCGTLYEAIEYTKTGFNSQWGDFLAEGLVLRPVVPLATRCGGRIITKVKHKDF